MSTELTPLTETNHFIVLDHYESIDQPRHYQTENDLERELIADLVHQGYEYRPDLNTPDKLAKNLREQIQTLNNLVFSDSEWQRFLNEYLDKPSDSLSDKAHKIHHDFIYDFVFDDGRIQNIYLLDKEQPAKNQLQVIHQMEQTGSHANRYDVSILVNGLPLVHIELKKRGVAIREAFNQIHRYSKESFNSEHSLFKFIQIFVISNGTDTRYFANTTQRNKNSFDFTMNWARADNSVIKDLKDFTATFFSRQTLLDILLKYSVLDSNRTLLIMRPYQIAATERMLWKIRSSALNNNWSNRESGGYIWHTTGSGKTLTSFKAAQLATALPFIDKVFFVVDRKDLDYQTIKEYQRFSPDSVNGSDSTAGLKRNIEKDDNKIIVTTIQKLNNLMKSEENLPIYRQPVVFIFDECHRSQFGEAQKNLQRKFKKYCQFGFTGTPIFEENALGDQTTEDVFGYKLHSYVITDAIRDEKVLKFKVDYNDVRPQFKQIEQEKNLEKLTALEAQQAFLHPERIKEIVQYILANFHHKTCRHNATGKGFNAMLAVSSVEAAKRYYQAFREQQAVGNEAFSAKPLKVATIFSFASNEEQHAIGEISDESFEPSAMEQSSREFLDAAIADYNAEFRTNFSTDSQSFQNYYRDLAQRVRSQEIDLLIVVGMFLTGFDAPALNTLFVDKNLRYHGLIQAFSRTNRIHPNKPFGNIVTFRDLEQATLDAITRFANDDRKNGRISQVVLERSFNDYLNGYTDSSGKAHRGYLDVVAELQNKFPGPSNIDEEADKKAFAKLFGEYLRLENVLQNYDEFQMLKQNLAQTATQNPTENEVREPDTSYLTGNTLTLPDERLVQDYLSTYNDIREWKRNSQANNVSGSQLDWSDVVFEVDLLKSQEINLDFILALIFEYNKQHQNKTALAEQISRTIRASIGHRAKEGLIMDFIEQTDLNSIDSSADMIEAFFQFAQTVQQQEAKQLIAEEGLNEEATKRYLATSLKQEYASENGTALNDILPKISPLNPQYKTKKQSVLERIVKFVEKFRGIGYKL